MPPKLFFPISPPHTLSPYTTCVCSTHTTNIFIPMTHSKQFVRVDLGWDDAQSLLIVEVVYIYIKMVSILDDICISFTSVV